MTGKRLIVIVVGTVGLLAIVAWAVATARKHDAAPAPAAAQPVDSTWPLVDGGRSTASSSTPPATRPAAAAPSPAAGAAAPFVQSFADQPGVRPLPAVPSPTATRRVPANVDGCDHAYGDPTQCVPWTFPPGTTDKCGWLRAHGFGAVRVVGTDRQNLDHDHDGIACDA